MKVASWLFTIFSFLSIVICTIVASYGNNMFPAMIIVGFIFFEILGILGHIFANSYRNKEGKGTFVWVISFPAYLVPFIILFALFLVFKFIDTILWIGFNRHLLSEWCAFIWKCCVGKPKKKIQSEPAVEERADMPSFYINVGGYRRRIYFFEQRNDYSLPNSPIYNRYRDDYGNFYRSYDGNRHFYSEKALKEKGHKDIIL